MCASCSLESAVRRKAWLTGWPVGVFGSVSSTLMTLCSYSTMFSKGGGSAGVGGSCKSTKKQRVKGRGKNGKSKKLATRCPLKYSVLFNKMVFNLSANY